MKNQPALPWAPIALSAFAAVASAVVLIRRNRRPQPTVEPELSTSLMVKTINETAQKKAIVNEVVREAIKKIIKDTSLNRYQWRLDAFNSVIAAYTFQYPNAGFQHFAKEIEFGDPGQFWAEVEKQLRSESFVTLIDEKPEEKTTE